VNVRDKMAAALSQYNAINADIDMTARSPLIRMMLSDSAVTTGEFLIEAQIEEDFK